MIDYDKRTLGDLLSNPIKGENESFFRVPRFQRKYEWEKEKEVLRLIDDIFDNLGSTYFMGPTIFCSTPNESCLEIVDGQQRLVTLAIFYRALVDYAQLRRDNNAFSEELRPHIEEIQYRLKSKIIRGWSVKRESVIHLSQLINKFFREEIILNEQPNKIDKIKAKTKGEIPSVKRLKGAYIKIFESLSSRLDEFEGEVLLDKCREISDMLEFRQIFLAIIVNNYADAYNIFETINERGKRLTLSDLVKNLCFRKLHGLGDELLDEFETDWDEAESLVSDFGAFMWHAWVSRNGPCPKTRVFSQIESNTKDMNPNQIWDFTSSLIFDEVPWYNTYENPNEDAEGEDNYKEKMLYLSHLKTMGATRCYPLLLSIDYSVSKAKTISKKKANELLKTITCLTFWHSGICENDAKELEKIYHNFAQKLRKANSQSIDSILEEGKNQLYAKFPTPQVCKDIFLQKSFTNDTFVKMLLRNIENSYKGEKTLKGNSIVWLEHILPRNPKSGSAWLEIFTDPKDRIDSTYKIGNLTLLLNRLDTQASNKPFSEKKLKYQQSEIKITRELLELDKWDSTSIIERTTKLFDLVTQLWPIYQIS